MLTAILSGFDGQLRDPESHHRGHRDHGDGSQSWEPWEGSHALPRWCAAGEAGGLPTRGKKGSDPDLEPLPSGLYDLCALCGEIRAPGGAA